MKPDDTIVAISSAVGRAARMIVRLSGPLAHPILRPIAGEVAHGNASRRPLHFSGLTVLGWIYAFRTPRSYTGQDLVEFHIPGNPLLARMLLDHLVRAGARLAEPGEFTARAYFNGRIDLAEAEGIAAAISAHGQQELLAARQLIGGELGRRLRPMMDHLADTLALVEAGIDFSDEDVTFIQAQELSRRCHGMEADLRQLLAQSARFERLSHEPLFLLFGRPNAGKSTLLNALSQTQRAIVSPIAGTTRDALTAEVVLDRGIIKLIDVAGIDQPRIEIEQRMQERLRSILETVDFVIALRAADDDEPLPKLSRPIDLEVRTKADLHPLPGPLAISALTGFNLETLKAHLSRLAFGESSPAGAALALNARHIAEIELACQSLQRAAGAAPQGAEMAAFELREALDALGRILGQMTPDDVLGRVFATFCIGK